MIPDHDIAREPIAPPKELLFLFFGKELQVSNRLLRKPHFIRQDDPSGLEATDVSSGPKFRRKVQGPDNSLRSFYDEPKAAKLIDDLTHGLVSDRFRGHAALDLIEADRFLGLAEYELDLVHGRQCGTAPLDFGRKWKRFGHFINDT